MEQRNRTMYLEKLNKSLLTAISFVLVIEY